MHLFNGLTGELRQIPKSAAQYTKYPWETLIFNPDELTLVKRRELLQTATPPEDEIFRPLPGADGLLVSSYGRVKKVYPSSQKTRFLMPYLKHRPGQVDYVCVKVKLEGKFKEVKVSKLVSLCFELPGKGTSVYHIDKNQWNNRATNLRYATPQQLIKVANRAQMQDIIKLDTDTLEELEYYPSIRAAGRDNFVSAEAIRQCLIGKQHTAGGYKWKYDRC